MLAESDRLRFLIPTLHREMVGELRWPGRDSLEEGLDVRTLELSPPEMAALEIMRRADVMEQLADWRAGQALGGRTFATVGSSSALAVITVPRTDAIWYVRGGAAVERFWLTAELHGLAVQPVSPVFLYAVDEKDYLELGGERHVDALFGLSKRFNELWDLDDGERVALLFRITHAAHRVCTVPGSLSRISSAASSPRPEPGTDFPRGGRNVPTCRVVCGTIEGRIPGGGHIAYPCLDSFDEARYLVTIPRQFSRRHGLQTRLVVETLVQVVPGTEIVAIVAARRADRRGRPRVVFGARVGGRAGAHSKAGHQNQFGGDSPIGSFSCVVSGVAWGVLVEPVEVRDGPVFGALVVARQGRAWSSRERALAKTFGGQLATPPPCQRARAHCCTGRGSMSW